MFFFFFSSRRRHTRLVSDWSSDVCSSDLEHPRDSFCTYFVRKEPRLGGGALDRLDRVLERGIVELHHVLGAALGPDQTAGQVDVDDVEAARAETEVAGGDVDDHLVARVQLAEQDGVGPGGPVLVADLHQQRLDREDDAAAQVEAAAHASPAAAAATMPSQTSSILTRLAAGTNSISALTSLPPPIATRAGSNPAPRSPASAKPSAGDSRGSS